MSTQRIFRTSRTPSLIVLSAVRAKEGLELRCEASALRDGGTVANGGGLLCTSRCNHLNLCQRSFMLRL